MHLIAIGANSGGSRAANLRAATRAALWLARRFGGALRLSPLYATPAWPPGSGPDFVNAAAALRAPIGPEALLRLLHRVEARAGRVRAARWGPRTLDLDLIASGGRVRPDAGTQAAWRRLPPETQRARAPDRLILPHPRMGERAFVLIPLAHVAAGWRHPLTGRSVAAMAAALPARRRREVRKLAAALPRGLVKP